MRLCQTCGRLQADWRETCARDGATLTNYKPTLSTGVKVAGNFSIVAPIGVGQSGEVYEGRSEDTGERVIVRLLTAEVAKDKRLCDVVRRHLVKLQEFEHEYVVRTRALDEHEGRILVVRDWVDGARLEEVLVAEGALGVQRTLGIAIRICSALAEAHKVGLLHLQVRASNVFVVPSGQPDAESVRLVDFGIGPRCKVGGRPYYGSPKTLSPEQIEGKIVSSKSDIFATGLLLYRMLAGCHAFDGSDEEVVKQICEFPVPPIPYRAADPIPAELWTILSQMLEKKPIHRPIGMAQVADGLRELAEERAAGRLSSEPSPSREERPAWLPGAGAAETPAVQRFPVGRIPAVGHPDVGPKAAQPVGGDATEVDITVEEPRAQASGQVARELARREMAVKPAARWAAAPPTGGGEHEEIKPSSETMPIEPEIIPDRAMPPPVGRRPGPPTGRAAGVGVVPGRSFGVGVFCGLGMGLAAAVAAFFLGWLVGRLDEEPGPGERLAAAPVSPSDAGAGPLPMVAAGPGQVGAVEDARSGVTTAPAEAGIVSAKEQEDVPAAAKESEPDTGVNLPATGEVAAAQPAAGVESGEVATKAPARRSGGPGATVRPEREGPAAEAGRGSQPAAGGGRTGGGPVPAENLRRANELVSEGDRALTARNYAAAQSAYEEALRVHPQNNRARIGLGRVAFQQGNFADAVRYLEPVYRHQGNMDLGMAYVRVGRLADAKRQFERLLERNPGNADAQRALEVVRRQLGE